MSPQNRVERLKEKNLLPSIGALLSSIAIVAYEGTVTQGIESYTHHVVHARESKFLVETDLVVLAVQGDFVAPLVLRNFH